MNKLEYIWIDGTEDVPQLRSKTKVLHNYEWDGSVAQCPIWGFDGRSEGFPRAGYFIPGRDGMGVRCRNESLSAAAEIGYIFI